MHDIFCFTDIHGVRPLYDAIMNYCNEQDPEATIIFCGDAMDRGYDGYAIMKELLDNPYVVYLKGNHEDMFVQAARNIKDMFSFDGRSREDIRKVLNACKGFDYKYAPIQDSLYNGGMSTLLDWIEDGMPMDIVDRVDNLPLTFKYENIDFCHASPFYDTFARVYNAEYEGKTPDEYDAEHLLWGRTTLGTVWAPNRIQIFGHTPSIYVSDYVDFKMDNDMDPIPVKIHEKIDMDTGAAFTGMAFVLNILTMQAQGFNLENDDVKKIDCIQF